MRTATTETVRALKRAIDGSPYSTWARANGLRPIDIYQALRGKSISAERENSIRAVIGLPPLRWQMVELLDGQKIIFDQLPREYKSRQVRIPSEVASRFDAEVEKHGYRSFNQLWNSDDDAALLAVKQCLKAAISPVNNQHKG